ncbi:MAG TPA: LysR family transcriptional regulator [Chloroflexota bacterium]|jgi:DNA-binding transcriptional LysR family regulator|nr:LysR family transcriptional regulator [Chloroflexota bacterium]
MELRQLATFQTVATTLSFTRAAETLDYAQSSVTAQIQALEAELGVALFERLGKRVVLTEAGQRLCAYADQLLHLAEEARAAVREGEEPAGVLTIGAPESLCAYRLTHVLMQFHAQFPHVQVIFQPGLCAELRHGLQEGRLDLAFLLEPLLPSGTLIVEPLIGEPMLLLAHPSHRLAQYARVEPRMLDGEAMLLTEAGCSYRVPFEHALAQAGARPANVMEFGSVEAIKHCVMAGMGVAFLPAMAVATELAQRRLVALPWTDDDYGLVTQMARHRDKRLTPALRAFITLTRQVLVPHTDRSATAS